VGNRRGLVAIIGIVALSLGIVTAAVIVAFHPGHDVAQITKLEYSQSKAVPDFDNSTHTVTDTADLSQLRSVLQRDGWYPGAVTSSGDGCTGGLTTNLHLTFADHSSSQLTVYQCGGSTDSLTTDVTELISSWS
jgi:hypothetical protein